MDTALLREAISKSFGSSHGNPSLQKEALEVLLRWRSSANSERFCLQALQGLLWPDIAPHEQFFFASSLRSTCGKSPLESLQGILPDAVCTLVLLVAGQESDSSTYSQLAFAVAVLAVRCCSWGPTDNVLTELMALHRHAAHNILGHEPHKMERVILVAYLEVLQALPVVASSSAITIHPDRRAMTKAVLAGSPMILPCIQSGLAAFGPVLMSAANVQAQGEQQLQSDMLPQFMSLADHLLKQLAQDNDDVALEAANFWTEIYIATLQSLPSSSNGPVNQHFSGTAPRQLTLELALQSPPHAALLQHLASRLVWRTQLKPEDATDATADARDVPEGARMLRRELASALRDIASLVGQSACDWAPLECTLYAANCILNRLEGTALEQLPDSTAKLLVNACTVSVTCPQGSPKLSGTSLTLLAGLAPWYTCRPEGMAAIPSILQAIGHTLQSSDAKLSRNGATSLQRMCHLPALAMHILDNHLAWVDQLLGVYAARGGMQQRAGKLEDSSTEEILLSTLCKLASLARSSAGNLIMQFASLQLTELIKVVGMMADLQLSDAHMIRTSPEYTPSLVPSNQVQLADRLAAVTPTVAQLCSAAALSSRRSSFMSSAGAIKSICDSIMVLTMIVESIEKHGTDEGTAASTSLQPGYQNIQNQLLELVSAVWTMISYMNQTQPCWQQTASAAPIFQATASMMSAALQKSDATTSSKVVQMSLVLLHGLPVNLLIGRGSCSLLSCCMEVYAQLHVPGGGATQTARPPNVQSNSGHDLDPFGSSLRNVVQVCMSAAGNVVLAPFRSRKVTEPAQGSDEDASSLLGLLEIVSTAVIHLPVCLVNFELSNYLPVLDSVLLAVAKAACSSDPDVCRKVLECLELLCCAPFHEAGPADSVQPGGSAAGKQGSKRQEAVRRIFASAPKHKTPSMSTGAAQLREQMDRGGGAKVLLTLLSAASGCMPPNMLLSISSTVHLIWTALGTPRFGAWLRTAIVCDAATLGMPTTAHLSWRRMKNEAKLEFLQELLSEESASDANKFKKHLKTFCGGKKKGGGGNRSVGGSTSYRDTPRA
eukprot:gene18526-25033_t